MWLQVGGYRTRAPLARYQALVLEPYLAAAAAQHAQHAAQLLLQTSVSNYMQQVLEGNAAPAPAPSGSSLPSQSSIIFGAVLKTRKRCRY